MVDEGWSSFPLRDQAAGTLIRCLEKCGGCHLSSTDRPLWLEGMFLRPQHFQQHDRWIEASIEERIKALAGYRWGVRHIRIDADAMAIGQLRVTAAQLTFPDGTVYSTPEHDAPPPPRQIGEAARGKRVFLAVPLKSSPVEDANGNSEQGRYCTRSLQVTDDARPDQPAVEIVVGALEVRLVIEGESLDGMVSVPIAEIEKVEPQGQLSLSSGFIPPVVVCAASPRLMAVVEEIRRLLRNRAEAISAATAGAAGLSPVAMLEIGALALMNRLEVILAQLVESAANPPELLYRELIGSAAELSAYVVSARRPPAMPAYQHGDLRATFEPLLDVMRGLLSASPSRPPVSVPLSERDFSIWVGEVDERITFKDQRFVLVAQAKLPLDRIRSRIPGQLKIGPIEQIRDLVNLQLPGIGLQPVSVAPREIPFVPDAAYFQLDAESPLWADLRNSPAFALHVGGEYPGLHLELWAIQKDQ